MCSPWGCSRHRRRRRGAQSLAAALVCAVALLSACASSGADTPRPSALRDDAITVGSFDFVESVVVAEVYSQGLEAAGYKVHRAFRLGPREFAGPALQTGLIEFLPEYAGTAVNFYSLGEAEPSDDVTQTHDELVRAVAQHPLVALAASAAQDKNTFVVTESTASRLHLETLSDLGDVADELTFGGPPECVTRELCLVGLKDTYGLTFGQVVPLDVGGPLTRRALQEGVVDVALLFSTDPAIANQGLVELQDDRGMQPAESITPLVRKEVVDRLGAGVIDVIDSVSARLTTSEVRDLNGAATPPGTDVSDVASAWWDSQVGP